MDQDRLVFYATENLYLRKQNTNLKLMLVGIGVYWLYNRGKAMEDGR